MGGREVHPWALSRKGKLGSSEVFIGRRHSPIYLKFQESWSKGGRASREMAKVYSLAFLRQLTSFGIVMQNHVGSPLGGSLLAGRPVKLQRTGKTHFL